MKLHIRHIALILTLLLLGGMANEAWAAKVTYHILTLPIDNSIYHMKSKVSGYRLEAVKVVVDNQTTVELPAAYKSPLATGFKYYNTSGITIGARAEKLFDASNNPNKGILYRVNGEETPEDDADDATPVAEGTTILGNTAEYYVVYTYNASNTIAQLNGEVRYNIKVKGMDKDKGKDKDKGFIALNRGRNNRPAVLPTAKVDPEILASEDFMKIDVTGTSVGAYWSSGDNKNKEATTRSKFFFMFKFEGVDPYNIIIRTAYNKDTTYIEKNDNSNPAEFVYKYYKKSSLFSIGTANAYIASDEHIHYNKAYDSNLSENPTTLTEGADTGYDTRTGYYHGQKSAAWNSFAILNNSNSTGYVLMGTRTVDGNGATPDSPYYLKEANNGNNLQITTGESSNNLSVVGFYPIKKVTFKVPTPFYEVTASTDHIISVSDWVSQYTVDNDPIETKYLPASLRRKYCTFNGKFYKDAARTKQITNFSDADYDNTEGYKVYIGYDVSASIPFKAITPAATYSAATWAGATWYELTDEASTQIDGMKLKYDGSANFKNDGADGDYAKTSEFAFIGDPYELQVVYRNATSGATPYFVGAAGTPPTTGTALTISTSATAGYVWQMPNDATAGSFLLQKYKDEGNWYWEVTRPAPVAINYSTKTHTYNVATSNAQAVTFNVSNLTYTENYYITVTASGTNSDQVSVPTGKIYVEAGGTASFTAAIKARGGSDKQFTLSIQQYDASNVAQGSASVITVNQNSSSVSSNTVQYSTASSTRVKVMELPKKTFTYKIVDKLGHIAVTASASQTIFAPLSLASIPSIIVSPFIVNETVTFYSSFNNGSGAGTGKSRTHLSSEITETPNTDASIYVKYTTTNLASMPFNLSEDQEIFVRLNGQYIYYDNGDIKSSETNSESDNRYKWKLRNRDPYAMLIDNLGARTHLEATGSESVTVPTDDNGTTDSESRQVGAWVKLAAALGNDVALTFDKVRNNAQLFIAKSSSRAGVYEVMVATGDGVDASTTYYHIGRPEENTIKIYSHATYQAGDDDEIKFRLEENTSYVYYLIDKAKHKLLTLDSKSPELVLPAEYQSPLVGAANYSYYAPNNITIAGDTFTPTDPAVKLSSLSGLDATFNAPTSGAYSTNWSTADQAHQLTATDVTDINSQAKKLTAEGDYYFKVGESTYYLVKVTKPCYHEIYVTYVKNDLIGFNNTGKVNDNPYLLKFLDPLAEGYYLEDGKDGLMTEKLKAIYPYCNGDGNLNIYGETMRDEQMNGGSSTRPRWVWFFESATNDPYHVRIHSRSTITYSGVSYPTYLQTYAVHFNQSAENVQTVVTGGALPGVASDTPTEYMVLGIEGAYKLLTTNEISADENGNGTIDGSETKRREVRSLEQYWKTYNMVKLNVLGISNSTDAYSTDASTWVVPTADDPETAGVDESTYRTTLATAQPNWHSYDVYANATRWNGYNDKEGGHEKKCVEKLEHWFQTFSMGNGTFNVESADIPPVLVLLDRHGWEIMRRPLPVANYPEGDDELAALRAYDSPMVDKYYFYSNATKASGCHKYTLRMQDGKERDQIKLNGEHYTSSSLGNLPPASASGVKSSGVLNDQFVIYTVKEEYENCYKYNFTDNGNSTYTESGTASKFLMLQNARFARDNEGTGDRISYLSKPIAEASEPVGGNLYDMIMSPQRSTVSNVSTSVDENSDGKIDDKNLWYVQPNLNIDKEMGIKWATVSGGSGEPLTEYETKKAYKDKTGFDPYNIQLKNVGNSKYLTAHMTTTRLENGIMIGDYSGEGGSDGITLEDWVDVKDRNTNSPRVINDVTVDVGYDHTNLQVTNQTFMVVSDANGNMQLMPRFDHTKRINVTTGSSSNTTLQDPVDHAVASAEVNSSMGPQTTFFVRAQRFIYHIIDNDGLEALRYQRSGDNYPAITNHFKSPLATDFKFYKDLTLTDGVYTEVSTKADISAKEIKSSLAAAGYTADDCDVYVRYNYDESADRDADHILLGQWFTVKLNDLDLQSSGSIVTTEGATQGTGVNLYAGETSSRSLTAANGDDVDVQAKKLTATGNYYFKEKDAENYWLVNVEVAYHGSTDATYTKTSGSYATLWSNSKSLVVNGDDAARKWQWKFLAAPNEPTLSNGDPNPLYDEPDPYSVKIYNRKANYSSGLEVPNPMGIPIKVPNANNDANRFALLSHPSGGYALAVAKTYSTTNYEFLKGTGMTVPSTTAATTATETDFNYKNGILSDDSKIVLNNDVTYHYVYHVITNEKMVEEVNQGNKLAVSAEQDNAEASSHSFAPYLPESIQSPLLNMEDYKYYGSVSVNEYENNDPSDDTYTVVDGTKLHTLYGLYDDVVYVRYDAYDPDKTRFKVPNKKTTEGGHVARDAGSNDVSMNINGGLPYNIIWYNDNMMQAVDTSVPADGVYEGIGDGGSQSLSGLTQYVWYFTGNDPYSIRIKHKGGKYVNGTTTLEADSARAMPFMLLKKTDYDYGILQATGTTDPNAGKKLTGYGGALTADASTDPTRFIIFGLSVHELIYHLIIANTCADTTAANPPAGQYVDIPYRAGGENTYSVENTWSSSQKKRIYGTTQRNLTDVNIGGSTHYAGGKYQLGDTIRWYDTNLSRVVGHTYSHNAGTVSIGDDLLVPNVFYRPNCTFDFYIEGVYDNTGTSAETQLNNRFKGLKLKKLMSASELIDKTVVVNIVYHFNDTLITNSGLDFVRSKEQNLWYTFETPEGTTPYLAHYTNAWGLQAMEGAETRYTNDYLWTPLGDPYGFKMYNRYMLKNSGGTENMMTMNSIAEGKNLYLAVPGTTTRPKEDGGSVIPADYGIFELITGNQDGYFRVHPMANNSGTQYYVRRGGSDYAVLSTTPSDWTFGLDMTLLEPYYERAGYVGGLTADGKTKYETAVASGKITEIQKVVYNDANIVKYTPGYYRLHNQPGVSSISPVRYASGYLHDTEKTAVSGGIPMHFYSRKGVSTTFEGEDGLSTGFTKTAATRGEIPVESTEIDPSTIFYFPGTSSLGGNPRSTMQTQGLYVARNANGDGDNGTTTYKNQRAVMSENVADTLCFSLMDIGGAVLLIHDGAAPATRRYLNYDQSKDDSIYDLRFYHESPTDDAKWCMQPVQKTATAGNGEMPLFVKTNNGGDGYYYTTFYAPFDVLLPEDSGSKTYNAFIGTTWSNTNVRTAKVDAHAPYAEGKFVPAGTPVIIRTTDDSGNVKLTLPTSSPSSPLTSCVFTGSYLETLLANDASRDVYTLGLPFTSTVTKDGTPVTPGDISAPLPEFANTGVGFYINATRNKEINAMEANWTHNNRYVLHNKIYYRAAASSRRMNVRPEFVPVIFDDDIDNEEQQEELDNSSQPTADECIYDLQGRCVANQQQVKDGTWRTMLKPGIYILYSDEARRQGRSGRKFRKK